MTAEAEPRTRTGIALTTFLYGEDIEIIRLFGQDDAPEHVVALVEAEAAIDMTRLQKATHEVTHDWWRRGLLRFNSRDDGSDDLLLADAILAAYQALGGDDDQ